MCDVQLFCGNKATVLSGDTKAQLRQTPTFIDASAKYKLGCICRATEKKKKLNIMWFLLLLQALKIISLFIYRHNILVKF